MTLEHFDKNRKKKQPKEVKTEKVIDKTPFYTRKRGNNIEKILRETILGYCKIWRKENIIPIIEEILEEARAKEPEDFFK